MRKESLVMLFKVMIIVILYYILLQLFDGIVVIIALSSFFLLYIIYELTYKKDLNQKLEMLCDAPGYIKSIQKKYVAKGHVYANLFLAYGYVYNGEIERAEILIKNYHYSDLDEIKTNIWFDINFKIAFYHKDKDTYMRLIDELKNVEPSDYRANEIAVAELLVNVFDEKYKELRQGLLEIIPIQKKRFRIVELEYVLALAHKNTGSSEDAIAVLEFMVKKDYRLIYTSYCKDLLEKLIK